MDFATIFTAFNPADAQLVRSRLEAAGFHPILLNENATMWGAPISAGGILVQVPEAADAREFLKAP